MDERRSGRRDTGLNLPAYLQGTRRLVGHVIDVSEGGVRLLAPHSIPLGDVVAVDVEVFDGIEMLTIPLFGTCRWSRPSVTLGMMDNGIAFSERTRSAGGAQGLLEAVERLRELLG